MSTETGSGGADVRRTVDNTLGNDWRTLMGVGAVISILGVLAIAFPFLTGVTLSFLLGILLLVGAVAHGAQVFSARTWKGVIWQGLLIFVYGAAGLSLLVNPLVGLTTLTILLIAYLLVDGVVEIIMGMRLRGDGGWGWVVASGVISLVLAWLLWAGWPVTAAWAVGLLFGVALLSSGVSLLLVAWSGRRAVEETTAAGAGAGA